MRSGPRCQLQGVMPCGLPASIGKCARDAGQRRLPAFRAPLQHTSNLQQSSRDAPNAALKRTTCPSQFPRPSRP